MTGAKGMDFAFGKEEEAFREEIRAFLKEEPPERFPVQDRDEGYGFGGWSREYLERLGEKGWIALTWPREWGGQGRSNKFLFVLWEELAYNYAPCEALFYSQAVGDGILTHGNEALKRKLLPRAARGKITFWEALTEPGAGSDLLSLTTTARQEGHEYVINGQKTFNSNAHLADWALVLARTDPAAPKARGVSIFMVDARRPGVTISPLMDMSGNRSINDIFFDEVRVPEENLLGEKNAGFQIVLNALVWDRLWARASKAPYCRHILEELIEYINDARPLAADKRLRHKLAEMATEIEVCHLLFLRTLSRLERGETILAESCMGKVFADELGQRFAQLATGVIGLYNKPGEDPRWQRLREKVHQDYLHAATHTLAGGTSEIQRTTIALRGLGLPRGR